MVCLGLLICCDVFLCLVIGLCGLSFVLRITVVAEFVVSLNGLAFVSMVEKMSATGLMCLVLFECRVALGDHRVDTDFLGHFLILVIGCRAERP